MNIELEQLKDCADLGELRLTLHALCSRFGSIVRLDILPARQGGRHQALCFFRLATSEQEQHLMWALGVGRFGGDLVVIVELHAEEFSTRALTPAPAGAGLLHGHSQKSIKPNERPLNA